MGDVRLRVVRTDDESTAVLAEDPVEDRLVSSVEEMRRLLADRGESLTDEQHHGLGTVLAVLAAQEYADTYALKELGKVLDGIHFPSSRLSAGQAFSRGLGEGLFELRRAPDRGETERGLLARVEKELAGVEMGNGGQ